MTRISLQNMDRWSGKVAIVTGASSGIGAATCANLVRNGLKVVGLDCREEGVQELSKKLVNEKGKLYAVKTELTNEEEILAAFKWTTENVGPVSILINNAGIISASTLIDGDTQDWKKVFDTNVMAGLIGTREAIKIMEENKIDGHIVFVNSVVSLTHQYFPGMSVYSATKHAIRNGVEVLRGELNERQSKIKLTKINPGLVKTEIFNRLSNRSMPEDQKKALSERPSLTSDEVSDAIVYALSTPPNVNIYDLTIKVVGELF